MKIKGVFLAAILSAVLCFSGHVLAALSGSGTEASPYLIQSRADFDEFANPANAGIYWASGKYTKLMCNLDLAGTTYTQAVIASRSTSIFFQGIFDGNNHTISHLTITVPTEDVIGLFGMVLTNGQIQDLGVENISITGDSYIGGLVGYNSGSVSGCYTTGSVNGRSWVGGLVGYNGSTGTLTSCYAIGSAGGIDGYCSQVGGLVGCNAGGGLTSCYAVSSVNGNRGVGGLVGANGGMVTSCYATGLVDGANIYDGNFTGGLVGDNSGLLISCYATGSVSGYYFVGGLVGTNSSSNPGIGSITSCYATGSVSGHEYVGGLTGDNWGTLISCYATGFISGYYFVGGLAGENASLITSCFWDKQTSGKIIGIGYGSSVGVTGKTTAEMMTLSTFTSASWDFSTTDGDAADWLMLRPNEDYPRLAWQAIYPGDIAGLYGVDMEDLNVLIEYWLGTWHVKADIVDDSIVNLMDLSVIGQNWMLTECGDCNGADITGDGNVDTQDVATLADQWLFQENPDCQQADIDNSGTADLADLSILAGNWMEGAI
jgi:hypothetical protein